MKKYLLLILGVVISFALHAQNMYLCGDNVAGDWTSNTGQNWTPSNAITLTLDGDYYKFKAKGNFKLSSVKADWDSGFNGSAICANGSWTGTTIKTLSMKSGSDNIASPDTNIEWYCRLSKDKTKLEAAASADAFAPATPELYLVGAKVASNWTDNPAENWTPIAPNVITLDGDYYKFAAEGECQLGRTKAGWDNGWKSNSIQVGTWSTSGNVREATLTNATTEQKLNPPSGFSGKIYYRVNKDRNKIECATSATAFDGTVVEPDPVDNDYTFYFCDKNDTPLSAVWTYAFQGSSNTGITEMKNTGKYIKEGDKYYPVWYLKPSFKPTSVIFLKGNAWGTNDANKLTGDMSYVQKGLYVRTGTTVAAGTTSFTLVDKVVTPVTPTYTLHTDIEGSIKNYTLEAPGYSYTFNFKGNEGGCFLGMKVDGAWRGATNAGEYKGTTTAYNMTATSAGNITFSDGLKGDVTFTYNPDTKKLTVSGGSFDTPVIVPTGKALYLHIKYDRERYGKQGENTPVYAYIYGNGYTSSRCTWETEQESCKMTLIDPKYSLFMIELTEEEVQKANAVVFYYPKTSGWAHYRSKDYTDGGTGVDGHDNANWAKYIYATASNSSNQEYAQQTYLTYEEFKALDALDTKNGGRRNIYLVGGGFTADGKTLSWKPVESTKFNQDEGCFFVKLVGTTGDKSFKMSWIDTKAAAANITNDSFKTDARAWATFDLGLIGVSKDFVAADGWKPAYDGNNGVNGKTTFAVNKSCPYMNYNQSDWVLPSLGNDSYLVVDTHKECHTATVTDFNPQPSLKVAYGEVKTATLTETQAEEIHEAEGTDHLIGTERNGHVVIDKVNYVSGSLDITGKTNSTLTTHTVDYDILLNGKKVVDLEADQVGKFEVNFLPLGDDESFAIRGMFTDKATNLTFHSRTARGTLEATDIHLAEPTVTTAQGRFVESKFGEEHSNEEMFDGHERWMGMYFEETSFKVESELNYYGDFTIENGDFFYASHPVSQLHKNINGVTPEKDWSNHMVKEQKLPLFIDLEMPYMQVKNLAGGKHTVDAEFHAVYPFLFNPNVKLTPVNKAPRRVAGARASEVSLADADLTGAALMNVYATTPAELTASNANLTLGVEGVEAEAESAEAEYYNLQGIRVAAPVAGQVYIVNRGGRVTKELAK